MRILKKIFGGLCLTAIVFGIFVFCVSDRYTVPVMMYHNVGETASFRDDTVSPANFEKQMLFLRSHGYHILTLTQLVEGIKRGEKFPHNCVAVTFDDGMKNNFTAAYPLLKKYEIPTNFFISPGTVGNDDSLSWSDVLTMQKGGMTFGSHGMVQEYLPAVPLKTQIREVQESKRILEAKLHEKILFYAYPVGGFNDEIKDLLKRSGYAAAFTTNRGTDPLDKDLYEINRIRFGDHDTNVLALTAKLSGYYNLFRKLKKSH